jgi:hypothetical protein
MGAELTGEQVDQVVGLVAEYIGTQREKYYSRGKAITRKQREVVGKFFAPQLLDGTRLVVLGRERMRNPDFYPMLRRLGFSNLPDQSVMAAVTFSDVVVSHELFSDGLLFHELVHVEQYRQLGIRRFSEFYVRGFLSGGSYEAIPLEVNAYTLGDRFEASTENPFFVAEEVKTWLTGGRF